MDRDDPLPRMTDEMFHRLVESVRDYAIFMLAPDGRIASWNRGAEFIKQYTADEAVGQHFSILYEPEAVVAGWPDEELRRALRDGRFEDEGWRVRKDGSRYWANVIISPLYDAAGGLLGFSKVTRDLSERRAHEERLKRSERHLRAMADNLPVLIAYISDERKLMFANQTFEHWMGLDPEQIKGKPVSELGTSIYEDRSELLATSLAGERVEYESVCHTLGIVRNLHTVLVPDVQPDGQVAGVYALSTDITASKAAEQHLHQLAQVDPLTGLPNRRQFEERLKQAMARSCRSKRPMAVIFMDIDHFKSINDSLGHGAGDEVLKEFTARLRGAIRATDLPVRLAGDEFVAILESMNTVDEASLVAEKLVEAIRQPMTIAGHRLTVTTSMGVACYEGQGGSPEALVERADRDLYRAKAAGRNTFAASVFSSLECHSAGEGGSR